MDHWILGVLGLVLSLGSYALGVVTFGWEYKQRIAVLVKHQAQPTMFNVSGDSTHSKGQRVSLQFRRILGAEVPRSGNLDVILANGRA